MMHSKLRIGNNRPDPPRGHAPLTKPRPMRQLSISHCKANNKGSSTPLTRTQSDLFTAIADGVGDSVSDIGRHLGRLVRRLPTSSSLDTILRKRGSGKGGHENQRDGGGKPVVLILGSGWVGHSMIKVIDTDSFEVVLISPRNFFMFTPMSVYIWLVVSSGL